MKPPFSHVLNLAPRDRTADHPGQTEPPSSQELPAATPAGPSWFRDKRFLHERRLMVFLLPAAVLGILLAALLAYSTHRGIQDAIDRPALSSSSGAPPSPQASATPPPPGALESIANLIVENRIDEASAELHSAEITFNRLQGIVAWKRGDIPTADTRFQAALRLDPDSAPDLVNLAGVRMLQQKPADAVALLARASSLAPDDVYIANRLMLARLAAGDLGGVRSEIRTALESAPAVSLPRVAFAAAALEIQAGQFANAANFLFAAQTRMPSDIFRSLLNESPFTENATRFELEPFFPLQHNGPSSRTP